MAYIAPNTIVKLCKGIPFDNSYQHTVFFATSNAQRTGFDGFVKYTLSNTSADGSALSYQRVKDGVMRVAILADNLYDCNYMIFQNTNFGNKWFYAFINKVRYINNATSEIEYELDVMQTFFFDYAIPPCFVEREHALTDVIGANVVPEDFGVGELAVRNKWSYRFLSMYTVIKYVANEKIITQIGWSNDSPTITTANKTADEYGFYQYRMYNGYTMVTIPDINPGTHQAYTGEEYFRTLNAILTVLVDIQATIVDIVLVPKTIYNDAHDPNNRFHAWPWSATLSAFQARKFFDYSGTQEYTPKNMKLYTYPYCQLVISNNSGSTATYYWEKFPDFQSNHLKVGDFKITGVADPFCEAHIYPYNYRNISDDDYESGLLFNQFYHASWSEDSFARWWSINKEAFITSATTSVIKTASSSIGNAVSSLFSGFTGGNMIGGIVGAGNSAMQGGVQIMSEVMNTIAEKRTHENVPDQIFGQSASETMQTWEDRLGFTFYDMGVEYDIAVTIDDFFTKFGYAQKRIKIPEIKNGDRPYPLRPYWNYIKTIDCLIKTNMPISGNIGLSNEDKRRIEQIYNNGITFWNDINTVGNYTLDNSIVVSQGD